MCPQPFTSRLLQSPEIGNVLGAYAAVLLHIIVYADDECDISPSEASDILPTQGNFEQRPESALLYVRRALMSFVRLRRELLGVNAVI